MPFNSLLILSFKFVGDEWCCSSLVSFFKNKVYNHVTSHLQLIATMYAQWLFTQVDNFPYVGTFEMRANVQKNKRSGPIQVICATFVLCLVFTIERSFKCYQFFEEIDF
jgi:hypothetical protein